jgi:hypothetical protein
MISETTLVRNRRGVGPVEHPYTRVTWLRDDDESTDDSGG